MYHTIGVNSISCYMACRLRHPLASRVRQKKHHPSTNLYHKIVLIVRVDARVAVVWLMLCSDRR